MNVGGGGGGGGATGGGLLAGGGFPEGGGATGGGVPPAGGGGGVTFALGFGFLVSLIAMAVPVASRVALSAVKAPDFAETATRRMSPERRTRTVTPGTPPLETAVRIPFWRTSTSPLPSVMLASRVITALLRSAPPLKRRFATTWVGWSRIEKL